MQDGGAVMTHDRAGLNPHGRMHEQEVSVTAGGPAPYMIRDEDPAGEPPYITVAHRALDDPG